MAGEQAPRLQLQHLSSKERFGRFGTWMSDQDPNYPSVAGAGALKNGAMKMELCRNR